MDLVDEERRTARDGAAGVPGPGAFSLHTLGFVLFFLSLGFPSSLDTFSPQELLLTAPLSPGPSYFPVTANLS